jgi:hypothetical protein
VVCQHVYVKEVLGCCNYMNSSKWCTGPVHLTSEWDIGLRPCCKGAGEKYTAIEVLFYQRRKRI